MIDSFGLFNDDFKNYNHKFLKPKTEVPNLDTDSAHTECEKPKAVMGILRYTKIQQKPRIVK